ncbi:F-box DNA helicase 1 [Larimichthys crocea]|uniref:F-box DNA helicase 1 n=1 Tax=Larimichthys crocea TaxID=215358 RepID=A0A6G0HQV8_LARCR|nr:F-box DNA helicase 1 isoform X2 [Larimichthys crocea]KAE8281648.1 F-box DNA helicase 1 [Larimichthys crocea]
MEVAVKAKVKRRHLNAADCDELGRSAEGTDALTQPHPVNHGNRNPNPNRGLYPRTPTKRRKCADSGSPSGRQKGINDFFSVTGVISSSPHKSSQPCSSTHADRLDVEPKVVKEEEEEEEEDDDISLLAAAVAMDPEAEEEVDDVSLLAADMTPELEVQQEEGGVDYLEGMTAEMFGDDDEFNQCDGDIHNECKEVEALPDTHYGLLGSEKVLLQPQGCMDDLPEEVLRQVLCRIPARDLYCNVSLVCQHWRNIVQDPKFVPFKKQYFRYMMRETATMLEVCGILKSSHIMDPASSEHSLRHLVVLMAQHKVGERVRPEDVLECVKKHRLFPQAEASIRLRIPDVEKSFNLGIEGTNPYAAMAVILTLSESVGDVQALVSLLTGCMSDTTITEYLHHMAMMLLALMRSNSKISNRLHYNIYYVLHLMENGPFPVSSGQSGRPQFHLTGEQQQILSHNIRPDHVVKIVAFAGTGKTTTLVKYAEQRPHLRFLYVAFNKSVASEAQRRFPKNVACKTVHSLAYNDVGKSYLSRKKLTFNLKPLALNSVLPEGRGGFTKAKVVNMTLNAFMASTDPTITISHVPSSHMSKKSRRELIHDSEKPLFVRDAQNIWNKMKDLNETKQEAYFMTHDGYLKLWQLQTPKPRLSDCYDVLFIDEAQDCTPAIMDVLLSQRCGKILVGDPHQQIYTFKGAVNALNIVAHTHIYYLTQSFRFGAEIAYVGATILKVCKGVQKILVGGKQKGAVCDDTADDIRATLRTGFSHCPGKTAILSRCNVSVFSEAVRLTDANPDCRIHFVGGVKGIGLDRIMDIWNLLQQTGSSHKPKFIRDPLIRFFAKKNQNPFWALKKYVTQTEDKELDAKLSIVEKYSSRVPELVTRLQRCFEDDFNKADFTLGTVHKAKGLEFDTVIISDDFIKVPTSRHNMHFSPEFSFDKILDDEWNLLYVAVTRAKTSLIITKSISRILTVAGEYFLKSEMPSSSLRAGEPIPCCVTDCPNCITPGSAFIMRKRQMKFADGVSLGGPLCERCVWNRNGPTAFLMTDDVLSMAEIPRGFQPVAHHVMLLALF